jgi:hypothetical protein
LKTLPERNAHNRRSSSNPSGAWLLVFPALVLFLTGCSVVVYNTTAPNPSSPSQPAPVAAQAGNISISPQYVALGLAQKQHFQATAQAQETFQWSVNGVIGGNGSVGTIDLNGNYTAPANMQLGMNAVITVADANAPTANYATAVATIIAPGVVTATINPQVATYSIYLAAPGSVYIDFGPDTSYGFTTWDQPSPSPNGGETSIFVAGMRAQFTYHMRAQIILNDGATFTDSDHFFLTGSPPATAPVTISPQNGQIPQPGIEMFDTLVPHEQSQAFATDLEGNVIWTYSYTDGNVDDVVQPIRLLPNGHFLVLISYASSAPIHGATIPPNTVDAVREVDLAGNTIRQVTESQLAQALAQEGYSFNLGSLHHDVLPLENGHWIMLLSVTQSFTNLPGYPGTTNVLGDVLVDIDETGHPVWVWNAFDHLDVNRHPYLFPDWTHSNALLYSADDHNLLLSVRHQNWIIKIDYADGQGSGKILWRLGEGGDFTLQNGIDPTDWFYAQHAPNYFSPNTTGVFRIGVMDDGDDRRFPGGALCGTTGAPACYSTAPLYQLNESAMTATLIWQYKLPPSEYSYFGGDAALLANGDLEADFCATHGGSLIQEVDMNGAAPLLVWQAQTKGTFQYRTERLPSLYPGVQW